MYSWFCATEEESFNEEGRCLLTDHGDFVIFNVYVPNGKIKMHRFRGHYWHVSVLFGFTAYSSAGERPARERLPYKLRFLRELRSRMDEYLSKVSLFDQERYSNTLKRKVCFGVGRGSMCYWQVT